MISGLNMDFPISYNTFPVELWESGNAPDYSTIYAQGVKAGRGATESYVIDNCPKDDYEGIIQVTGNPSSDIRKYNYIGIDFGNVGNGKKWYFVTHKKMLNYPDIKEQNWYACEFTLRLDFWETYKDKIGNPQIKLEQVTTSAPSAWEDISMLEQDILPFSGTEVTNTSVGYGNWKTIVGWQAKKPTEQDNFIIDGMRTTLQFNDTGELDDYLTSLDELAQGDIEETNIWKTYLACNTYVVSDYFSTENGGSSQQEIMELANPNSPQVHNRLNYYPYKRAFVSTVDGQQIEFDYKRYLSNKLPPTIRATIHHSTLPQPTSVIELDYGYPNLSDMLTFSAYPSMDFVGKNITPVTQLVSKITEQFNTQPAAGVQSFGASGRLNGG